MLLFCEIIWNNIYNNFHWFFFACKYKICYILSIKKIKDFTLSQKYATIL